MPFVNTIKTTIVEAGLAVAMAIPIGLSGALFLYLLEWSTQTRLQSFWLVWLLPFGGGLIGWMYHKFGQDIQRGNNWILEEIAEPQKPIPFKMAPMVVLGTLATHLFGGSAGREGTAVQMGAAFAALFGGKSASVRLRRILLTCGVSAGFSAVFGTPIAAFFFALEWAALGKTKYYAAFPAFVAAWVAFGVCHLTGIPHTDYSLDVIPSLSLSELPFLLLIGGLFGWTAWLFSNTTSLLTDFFSKTIGYPPLRPFLGGTFLAVVFWLMDTQKYMGLGIAEIQEAFVVQQEWWVFLLKLIFTAITIAAGFKGGEVTPLFFIGAALGSALGMFLPLELFLLAALGFVGVFSGATNTPIACTFMAMELFGFEIWPQAAIVCFTAYLFSGQSSIYSSQQLPNPKYAFLLSWVNKKSA